MKDHHFDAVFDAYLDDAAMRAFLAAHNPDALVEMAERSAKRSTAGCGGPSATTCATR